MGLCNLLSLPPTGDGKGLQTGAVALDDVGDVDVQRRSTAVDESKVQITLARLAQGVFLYGNTGLSCHLLGSIAHDLAKFADTGGHFLNFVI